MNTVIDENYAVLKEFKSLPGGRGFKMFIENFFEVKKSCGGSDPQNTRLAIPSCIY